MTQVVRQKWVLAIAAVNALLALAVMAVVVLGLSMGQRAARDDGDRRDAKLREQLEAVHAELVAQRELRTDVAATRAELHAGLEELRRARAQPADTHLAQTLQLLASEQQLLLMRSLAPAQQAQGAAPKRAARAARRPSRPSRSTACPAVPGTPPK